MRILWVAFVLLMNIQLAAQDLSVMTYNIRFESAQDGENNWEFRKERLVAQIKFYAPDILGIQEGRPGQVRYLDEQLPEYAFFGVGRDDGKDGGEYSAIYYRKDKFKVSATSTFWLSPTPEVPSKGWDAAYPRICTFGRFNQNDQSAFWAFNTHFDHVGETARLESMRLILDQINKLNQEKLPVVLMGDLNAEPDKAPILLMLEQLSDSRTVAELSFGPDATFNAFQFDKTPTRRIDYIGVSDEWRVEKYAVLTDSYDQKYISDHFPVYCELAIID